MNTCPNTLCGATTVAEARYCHQCGRRLFNKPLNTKQIVFFLVACAVLVSVALFSEKSLLGTKPLVSQAAPAEINDERINALKVDATEHPQDINKWRILAAALQDKLSGLEKPEPSLVFEFIDSLRGILSIDPKDKDALIGMAELAYSQQAFDKAAEFYQSYLSVVPEDSTARANFGSALSFIGKYKEAEKELNSLIAKDPKNFQALAYLSIAYSRENKIAEAKSVGKKALAVSPDKEATLRFTKFLESLDKPASSAAAAPAKADAPAPPASVVESPKGKFLQFLFQHPIIGPKIASHEFKGDSLILTMNEFPMDVMPEVAKAKLVEKLQTQAKEVGLSDIKAIVFIDNASKGELGRFPLQ